MKGGQSASDFIARTLTKLKKKDGNDSQLTTLDINDAELFNHDPDRRNEHALMHATVGAVTGDLRRLLPQGEGLNPYTLVMQLPPCRDLLLAWFNYQLTGARLPEVPNLGTSLSSFEAIWAVLQHILPDVVDPFVEHQNLYGTLVNVLLVTGANVQDKYKPQSTKCYLRLYL